MGHPVIVANRLSKRYRLGRTDRANFFQDLKLMWSSFRHGQSLADFTEVNDRTALISSSPYVWALREASFELGAGDALGIVGANGAGKSTLLKILSKLTPPTSGQVKLRGRVASLLEVGTGFHPDLTGRENIFLNGAILGMTKSEIIRNFDEIVEFAGVQRYLDTPVKRYSSGMYVRLAFAVAAHLQSDILIVDEVLAVGDAEFQRKCLGKMRDVAQGQGRTVLFVSHNLGAVSNLCNKAILVSRGRVCAEGPTDQVLTQYSQEVYPDGGEVTFPLIESRGQFTRLTLLDELGVKRVSHPVGSLPTLEIEFLLREDVKGFHVACMLYDSWGNHIFSSADTDLDKSRLVQIRNSGNYLARVSIPALPLNAGRYNIALGMGVVNAEIWHRVEGLSFELIDGGDFGSCKEGARRSGLLLVEANWVYQ